MGHGTISPGGFRGVSGFTSTNPDVRLVPSGGPYAASFRQRDFGWLQRVARREAMMVRSHGRDDVVLLGRGISTTAKPGSASHARFCVSEFTDEDLAALDSVEFPAAAA
jgi:hypothetical protein